MKKNDKIKILLSIMILCMVITWFVTGGTFGENGVFALSDISRAGFYDMLLALFYSFYYNSTNIFFLFLIGGSYGVLSKTKSYRKLVDKTAKLVSGREVLFHLITTLVTAIFVSLTSNAIVVFMYIPFIISVFLRCKKDRIIATSAGIGGILIGLVGSTFGTYGVSNFINSLSLKYTQGIGYKIAIFVVAYILYNLFAILYINKQYKDVDETEYDLFLPEVLDERELKRNKRTKLWPIILISVLLIITTILAYINWKDSFGIKFFEKLETGFEGLKVKGIPILYNIVGTSSAFGEWSDTLGAGTLLFYCTLIISLIDKVSINNIIENFLQGLKSVVKVVVVCTLTYGVFIVLMWYGWPFTLVNALIGSGKFNMFTMFIAAMILGFFCIEKDYIGYAIGGFLAANFKKKLLAISLIMSSTSSLVIAIAPTSLILMTALTLTDIPYKKWFGFIWKYALAMLGAINIILAIMIYM